MRRLHTLLCFSLMLAKPVHSQPQEYPYVYRSGYFLGRGDTGIAIADDEEAIFYNPAGIAVGKGIFKRAVFASPMVQVSTATRDVVRQIALQDKNPTDTLRQNSGKVQFSSATNFTGIILRKSAFGAYIHNENSVLLAKDWAQGGFETIYGHAFAEAGATFTLASTLFGSKTMYVGLTGKYAQRTEGQLYANATEADRIQQLQGDELAMTGTGSGVDLGFMYRTRGRTPIGFGLTIKNAGNMSWTPSQPTALTAQERPLKDTKQTVNIGVAMVPGTKLSKFKMLFDVRDLLNATETTWTKKVHIGTELTLRDSFGFMSGINQGYPTFGFYIDTRVFRVDLGGYSEEYGEQAGIRPDQRYYVKISGAL